MRQPLHPCARSSNSGPEHRMRPKPPRVRLTALWGAALAPRPPCPVLRSPSALVLYREHIPAFSCRQDVPRADSLNKLMAMESTASCCSVSAPGNFARQPTS